MKRRDKILQIAPVFYALIVASGLVNKFNMSVEDHSIIIVGVSCVMSVILTEVTRQGIELFTKDNNEEEED